MKRSSLAALALIAVAISWGGAFVLMKDAITQQPFYDFLAIRFTIATIVMLLIRPNIFPAFTPDLLKKGFILGLLLGGGYITQTIGLELTTAAITGFVTGLYVVVTPLLAWIFLRQTIDKRVIWGVALATVGLGLISISGFSVEVGQIWVMLCAVLFAAHIFGLSIWSPDSNTYALTIVQLATVSLVSWAGALITDGYQPPPNGDVWFAVLFTAFLSTALAFFVQTWAQSIMDASRVAIILTSEVLFTAIIAVAVGQEVLGLKTIIGGAIMLAAMLLVEWPDSKNRQRIVPLEPFAH
jgi:drug/metabolite transporter (DMT)-like permease